MRQLLPVRLSLPVRRLLRRLLLLPPLPVRQPPLPVRQPLPVQMVLPSTWPLGPQLMWTPVGQEGEDLQATPFASWTWSCVVSPKRAALVAAASGTWSGCAWVS